MSKITENVKTDNVKVTPDRRRASIVLIFVTLVFLFIGAYFYLELRSLKQENEALSTNYQAALDEIEHINSTIIYDNGTKQVETELYSDIPRNQYSASDFQKNDNGFITYTGQTNAIAGIDVSYHQGTVRWDKVAAAGIDFAMVRTGYRGYGTGDLVEDDRCREYLAGADSVGINCGAYFFSQAINEAEAIEEACFLLNTISDYNVSYPIAFDWEPVGNGARADNLGRDELTDAAVAFCETVKDAGYTPVIYCSITTALFRYDLRRLKAYDIWIAEYTDVPDYCYAFGMWQYSNTAIVDGIDTYVDLNLSFKDYTNS